MTITFTHMIDHTTDFKSFNFKVLQRSLDIEQSGLKVSEGNGTKTDTKQWTDECAWDKTTNHLLLCCRVYLNFLDGGPSSGILILMERNVFALSNANHS